MTKRMLIDSTHAEETRVVVLEGNRLEDFDIETSTKHQLKGNIYLAKVVRVEASLQAAFVEYGGNRHGFLAFGEIHPDYYQIPVADRKRLIEAQEAEAREDEERAEREVGRAGRGEAEPGESELGGTDFDDEDGPDDSGLDDVAAGDADEERDEVLATATETPMLPADTQVVEAAPVTDAMVVAPAEAAALFPTEGVADGEPLPDGDMAEAGERFATPDEGSVAAAALEVDADRVSAEPTSDDGEAHTGGDAPEPEQIGGENDTEDHPVRRSTPRFLRNYKIQEVIRRRQILLVQVVKEERGSKGAALTTYISLAGRFSVLMPNSPRGGGISRKITSAADRRRLKEVTTELDLPRGMGLIVRTAGANRPKPEILRDCEYLLNQWDQIRDLTMKSMAPALIYEEASLIKRAIRDVYSRDVDDILVDGETGWRAAREFMRMLMPTHARKVQLWKDPQPLFAKAQVENQLEAILAPTVQLKSGGYLVINQTEALVAIDVNSGRSTRERGIEETALRTNLEAAEEAARQLRLRDLAGLIVIDFIDMESRRNVGAVERRLKESLRHDRARIQVGNISHFGLLEMSRQRLRPSLNETNYTLCPHCGGTGQMRSTESSALFLLRGIEEEGGKRKAAEIVVHCPSSVALYILNHKRDRLTDIEARHAMRVTFAADEQLLPPAYRIERVRAQATSDAPPPVQQLAPPEPFEDPDEIDSEAEDGDEDEVEAAADADADEAEESDGRRRRRRRRRRGGRREDGTAADEAPPAAAEGGPKAAGETDEAEAEAEPTEVDTTADAAAGDEPDKRRRNRRGGRRRRRDGPDAAVAADPAGTAEDDEPVATPSVPSYSGPTPADPFGGANAFDFFDAIEQAEEQRALAPARQTAEPLADLVPDAAAEPMPEPAPDLLAEHAPEQAAMPAPEQAAELAPEAAPPPPHEYAAEPVVGPAVQPVVIGGEAAPSAPKRGWWRR